MVGGSTVALCAGRGSQGVFRRVEEGVNPAEHNLCQVRVNLDTPRYKTQTAVDNRCLYCGYLLQTTNKYTARRQQKRFFISV